jgi:hypothetical protein
MVEYHNISMSKGVFLLDSNYSTFMMNWHFVRDSEKNIIPKNFSKKNKINITKSTGESKKSLIDLENPSTGGRREKSIHK